MYCFNRSLKLVTTVDYTGSHACGLLYQMEVDFIRYDIKTKPDRKKQEEFLNIIRKVMKYTTRYVLCNRH